MVSIRNDESLDDCASEVSFIDVREAPRRDSPSETMVFDGFSADARISSKTSPRVTL